MARYNITYDFTSTLFGTSRTFDKGSTTMYLQLSSTANNSGGRADDFVVQLQVDTGRGFFTVKTASFPRNGFKGVRFTDLPALATKYRLRMEKSTDGVRVTGSGVMHDE